MNDNSTNILEARKNRLFRGSLVASIDTIGFHNLQFHKTGLTKPSKERLFLLPLSILFRKHSCLVPAIDHQIELLNSNGLIEKWSKSYRDKYFNGKIQMRKEPKTLTFIEISGIYIFCTFLFAISIILFIAEVISMKIRYLGKLFMHVERF